MTLPCPVMLLITTIAASVMWSTSALDMDYDLEGMHFRSDPYDCYAAHHYLHTMVSLKDFESYAERYMDKKYFDYYKSGSNFEQTVNDNQKAFLRYKIRPRVLMGVAKRELSTTILGRKVSLPIGISPAAFQKMASDEGELDTARAARDMGTVMGLSALSTASIEEVGQDTPDGLHWIQLYVFKERDLTKDLVERAEANGFTALLLTVDSPFGGRRFQDYKNNFTLPKHLKLANIDVYVRTHGLDKSGTRTGAENFPSNLFDQTITLKDVQWLKNITKLPIVAKGVLTGGDAIALAKSGVSAILVSNHGGRQLDGDPATIDALPEVVKALKGTNVEVYLDGGIRSGSDVFKALALGAKAVFIGRPTIWGLAHSGQEGVTRVLQMLRMELDMVMGLAGVRNISEIKPTHVVSETYYENLWPPKDC